jgi:hypothetical protein
LSCSLAILAGCGVTHAVRADGAAHADGSPTLRGELAGVETAITVEAGEHAPRLTALSLRGTTAWKNRAEDILPEGVEVRGKTQHLQWRLDRSASRFGSKQIRLVYLAESPRLRLVWLWRARAGRGPLEHTMEIKNLSNEPVWLPFGPSFRYDWEVDPKEALERFWVE